MKSYTDIEQSSKLAEILPLESADMNWHELPSIGLFVRAFPYKHDNGATEGIFPCWSLAALFGVLPMIKKGKDIANPFIARTPDEEYYVVYATLTKEVDSSGIYDNPVDACYEMILKLNELNLL